MKEKERFEDWIEKHATTIVEEVLKEAESKQNDGEYQLYNEYGGLVNTYSNREAAISVAKKKHLTIRHVKKLIQLGLVSTHREFFPKTRKFRNIYNLTISGVYAAKWLIKQKKEEKKWKKNGYNNTKKN